MIVSARESIASYQNDPAYAELRATISLDKAIDYIGDYDSISSLAQQLEDDAEDDLTLGTATKLPDFDSIFGKLCEFNEEYLSEIKTQIDTLGIIYNREVVHAAILSGGRVVLGVDNDTLR